MIRTKITGAKELAIRLESLGRNAPKAASRAINRTLSTMRTAVVRGLAADTGLTQTVIRSSLKADRATYSNLLGTLTVSGKRIPILDFGARQTRTGIDYGRGSARHSIPHAFLATMPTGHLGVFARTGKFGRRQDPHLEHIKELFGPSLPHVVVNKRIFEALPAEATLQKNLEHEIEYLASQGTVDTSTEVA